VSDDEDSDEIGGDLGGQRKDGLVESDRSVSEKVKFDEEVSLAEIRPFLSETSGPLSILGYPVRILS